MPEKAEGLPLSAIHIDLAEGSITLEAENKPVAKLVFSSGTIYFNSPEQKGEGPAVPEEIPQSDYAQEPKQIPSEQEAQEKEKTVTLTGKLKTKPKQGRIDNSGYPTAYAKFAAHEEGDERSHIYLASFYRATANIALNLNRESQITVQGYPHLREDPKKMDTFSVVRILNYPGRRQHK